MNEKNYIKWLELQELSPRTISEYNRYLGKLMKYVAFDQENVTEFMEEEKSNMSNVARSFLRSYKEYLIQHAKTLGIKQDELEQIRYINIPKRKNKERQIPNTLKAEEVERIASHMGSNDFKLLTLMTFYCGLRMSEVITLGYDDTNIAEWQEEEKGMGKVTIIGKGNKVATIPVPEKIMKMLYDFAPHDYDGELIFKGIKRKAFAYRLGKVGKDVLKRHIKPHTLRHSAAMHLRGHGFAIDEIKEFLRHKDITTTQIYSRVTPEQLMKRLEELKN